LWQNEQRNGSSVLNLFFTGMQALASADP